MVVKPLHLAPKETLILDLLHDGSSMYGLQMVDASRGKLKRGTIYVTLGRMEDKGFICSRTEEAPEGAGGLPRRLYQATPLGLRVHKAWSLMLRELKTLKPAATK